MKPKKKPAIIFDVDGTLCDNRSILHLLTDLEHRDFEAYHEQSLAMPVHKDVYDMLRQAKMNGFSILIVTARPEKFRKITTDWLLKNNIFMDELHMRSDKDKRPDELAKQDILKDLKERYQVVHAVDDNPHNVKLFKKEKIGVTVVPGYNQPGFKGDRLDNSVTVPSPLGSGKCLRCGRKLVDLDAMFGPECARKA